MSKPRLIAFYLPQFYPTQENDEWWEPGFTEWTNVARAKPLFPGHYQPRIPRDLGFYDLRVPETREKQVELAREAGIEGFCYWHYWFAGRRLLNEVFDDVVKSGKPDFPFCLCWANHSWYKKIWDPSKGEDKLLIEQTYPGEQDFIDHFYAMLPAFKDPRYMKVNGRLIFGTFIYPEKFDVMKRIWNQLAKENGLEGFYFFAIDSNDDYRDAIKRGYDACAMEFLTIYDKYHSKLTHNLWRAIYKFTRFPRYRSYDGYIKCLVNHYEQDAKSHPIIVPNFDHSPRSKNYGCIMNDSTPQKWKNLLKATIRLTKDRPHEENLIFIKAWNEWGEGNYMEPDHRFGKEYINATKYVLES